MLFSRIISCGAVLCLVSQFAPAGWAADDKVATSVSAKVGNGYKRARKPDGSFKPEYYAISNGGRVYGTTSDSTVDRVQYPEVAAIAMRLLAGQNYHYAKSADEASLLLVLQWGSTLSFNRGNYDQRITSATQAFTALKDLGGSGDGSGGRGSGGWSLPLGAGDPFASEGQALRAAMEAVYESHMFRLFSENNARDAINLPNARLLGYLDEINDAGGLQRYAGAGARYEDLIADIEESRYYIIISAYDFPDLVKRDKRKLMWTTRVSVRSPGNRFDDSAAAMLKSASKYFGQDSGRLIRAEETKGSVELGDVKFMGEEKEPVEGR
jgi:hypothetical protein